MKVILLQDVKGKGKKGNSDKEEDEEYNELREWKDDNDAGASIADLLGSAE